MATDVGVETIPIEITMEADETGAFCLGPFRPEVIANAPRIAKYVNFDPKGKRDYLHGYERTIGQQRSIQITPSAKGSLISEVGKGVSLQIKSTKGEDMATIEVNKVGERERGISSLWIYNQERKGWEETSQPPKHWSSIYLFPITGGVVILDKNQASNSEIMASLKQAVNNLLINETQTQYGALAPDFQGYPLAPGV